jgi:outer membrane protein assembly factor BamB
VLVYGDQYAGTWSGGNHGGHVFGRIERADAPAAAPQGTPSAAAAAGTPRTVDWPSFRGPSASGVAQGFATPETWDIEQGENVRWRTPIPGLAHSSPVVCGNRVFVTTSVGDSGGDPELKVGLYGNVGSVHGEGPQRFQVVCVDKQTGAIQWTETAFEGLPRYERHPKGSFAASTCATDGANVVAFFGTEGLYCYTVDGKLRWKRDLGDLDAGWYMQLPAQWGFASSPVIHGDRVLVQCDVQKGSFVAALDLATGKDVWRAERDEVPGWGTPSVHVGAERSQVIVNGYKHIGAYDLATGRELWKLKGGGDIPVPTPVVAGELVFITNAHGAMAPIYAIKLEAEGEITMESPAMAWSTRRGGNYMQTPLVYGEHLYACHDAGILACYVAATGEEVWKERLGSGKSGFTASGIAADGKLYFTSEDGEVHVLKAGKEFAPLAVNDMGEECMATPAASDGLLLWRTRRHLVAIAAD